MSLPKHLYPLAKSFPIPSEWLFVDDINARTNNIKAQEDRNCFQPKMTFDRQANFPKQN